MQENDNLNHAYEEDPELGLIQGVPNRIRWKIEEEFSDIVDNLKVEENNNSISWSDKNTHKICLQYEKIERNLQVNNKRIWSELASKYSLTSQQIQELMKFLAPEYLSINENVTFTIW